MRASEVVGANGQQTQRTRVGYWGPVAVVTELTIAGVPATGDNRLAFGSSLDDCQTGLAERFGPVSQLVVEFLCETLNARQVLSRSRLAPDSLREGAIVDTGATVPGGCRKGTFVRHQRCLREEE